MSAGKHVGLLPGLLLGLLFVCPQLSAQTIVFISDLNGRYGNPGYDERVSVAMETIVKMQPDLVICTGDMVAGQRQPSLDSGELDLMWRGFNRVVTEPLEQAGIPLLVTPGNHDGSAFPEFVLEQQHFKQQWEKHRPEFEFLPGSDWPRRYGVLVDDVLIVAFDGTRPGPLAESELLFLQNMLRAHAPQARKKIVLSHLPMWPFATGREHEILDDPDLLQLLHENSVDVYASGHHHVYFPGRDDSNMIHLAVGALGGNARKFSGETTVQDFSFAILEFQIETSVIKALAAPGFTTVVLKDKLPGQVIGPLGRLTRVEH